MARRPLSWLPSISCDDACHKRRGSLGGTDYKVGVGTPVYAMFSGIARFRVAGTGGWTITINRDVDHQVGELMHLFKAPGFTLGGASHHVNEGDLVALSGGRRGSPGSGSATGPHLHAHVYVNGTRYGMEEYLHNPQWAGGGTPIDTKAKGVDMSQISYLFKEEGGTEYGVFGQEIPGGSLISDNLAEAESFGVMFGVKDPDGGRTGAPWMKLSAKQWASLIAVAKKMADNYFFAITSGGSSGDGTFTPADRERLHAVPTAEQNGQAARDTIVK